MVGTVERVLDIWDEGFDSIILFTDKTDHDYFEVYKQVAEVLSDEILFVWIDWIPEERQNVAMAEYFGASVHKTIKNLPEIYIKHGVVAYKFYDDVRSMTVEQLTDFIRNFQ